MTEPTPEQKKAQRVLDDAVEDWLRANDNTGICTSWILVAHMHDVDADDEISSYPIGMTGGSLPSHVLRGLLGNAMDIVRGIGRWLDDDD